MKKSFRDNKGNKLEFHGPVNSATVWYFRNDVCEKALFVSLDLMRCDSDIETLKPVHVGPGYHTMGDIDVYHLMKKSVKELRAMQQHA